MTEGPLDVVRRIGAEAAELDEFAKGQPDMGQSELYSDFVRKVFERDNYHPLIGEQVIAYGMPLTLSMEHDEPTGDLITHPMAIAADREYRPAVGKYVGLTVKNVYDASQGKSTFRVVHMIHTGSTSMTPDEHGHMQQTHFHDYILAEGSEIVPYNPVNAHSLADLEDDPIVSEIDRLAFSDDMEDNWRRIEEIGLTLAILLSALEHEDEKNQQRLSYLNSLGLLDDVIIVTDDFLLGDKHNYETMSELAFNTSEFAFQIFPRLFHFLNGYKRMANGIALNRAPELFIEGDLENGDAVLLPFQNIAGGYSLQ